MRIIEIHNIIEKIKIAHPYEWTDYIKLLSENNDFGIDNELLYTNKGIINNITKKLTLNTPSTIRPFWDWSRSNRKNIKFIKAKFVEYFIEEVKFCPYCGKMPLISYGKNKSNRAYDLDHIYPWSKYKYLTFNFYNLIPSCKICNTIKNELDLSSKGEYYHPYLGFIGSDKKSIDVTKCFDREIDLSDLKMLSGIEHARLFNLIDIYNNSQDSHNDIEFIRHQEGKILSYGKYLNFMGIKDKKDFFFKNFYPENPEDILKFANGKLKRDMINSLKI